MNFTFLFTLFFPPKYLSLFFVFSCILCFLLSFYTISLFRSFTIQFQLQKKNFFFSYFSSCFQVNILVLVICFALDIRMKSVFFFLFKFSFYNLHYSVHLCMCPHAFQLIWCCCCSIFFVNFSRFFFSSSLCWKKKTSKMREKKGTLCLQWRVNRNLSVFK